MLKQMVICLDTLVECRALLIVKPYLLGKGNRFALPSSICAFNEPFGM